MALPTSGPLGIFDIQSILNVNDGSLFGLSQIAGFYSSPYRISNFYGYSPTVDVSFRLTGNYYSVYLQEFGIPDGFSVATRLVIGYTYRYFDDMEGEYGYRTRGDSFTFASNFGTISKRISGYPFLVTNVSSINYWYVDYGATGLNVTSVFR